MLYDTETSSLGESSLSEEELSKRKSDLKRRSFRVIDDFLFDKQKLNDFNHNDN